MFIGIRSNLLTRSWKKRPDVRLPLSIFDICPHRPLPVVLRPFFGRRGEPAYVRCGGIVGARNERLRWQLASGVLRALHLERLEKKYSQTTVMAGFHLINGGVSIALVSFIALLTQEAFIFPSLGATAFILFHVPLAEPASPRNALCGHLIGALTGLLALYIFGLQHQSSAFIDGVHGARVGAAALSLGLTACLMVLFRVPHPPAGATTLIVSLGLMPDPAQVPVLMAGVFILLVHAFLMNRLSGIPYPLWRSQSDKETAMVAVTARSS